MATSVAKPPVKAMAIFILALLAVQEVQGVRQKVALHHGMQNLMKDMERFGIHAKSMPMGGAPTDDPATCSEEEKQQLLLARQAVLADADELAKGCETAAEESMPNCMSAKHGPSSHSVMQGTWAVMTLTAKFSQCPWATELADSHNEEYMQPLMTKLQRAYDASPEKQQGASKGLNINIDRFQEVLKKQGDNVATNDVSKVKTGFIEVVQSLLGQETVVTSEDLETHMATSPDEHFDMTKIQADVKTVGALTVEPCYRKVRTFHRFGGCNDAENSCFRFMSQDPAGYTDSEDLKDESHPPDIEALLLLPENDAQVLLKEHDPVQYFHGPFANTTQAGYLRNSRGTWGVCLPNVQQADGSWSDPREHLRTARRSYASMRELAAEDSNGTVGDLVGGEQGALLQTASTLMQHLDSHSGIGLLIQLPAMITLMLLLCAFAIVAFTWSIVEAVYKAATAILLLLGDLGTFVRWILFWPLCAVTALLGAVFALIFFVAWGVIWLGYLLGGEDPENLFNTSPNSQREQDKNMKDAFKICSLEWHMDQNPVRRHRSRYDRYDSY